MAYLNPRKRNNSTFSIHQSTLVIGALTLLYLVLPTQNSTLDAWYYAACVRYGHDLLLPHHLLYNTVGWLWARSLAVVGLSFDTLAILKVLNALAAGASLLVVRQMLQVLRPGLVVWPWLLLVGASFGVLRFATENETYVLPLLLSLLASQAWVRYQFPVSSPGAEHLLAAGFWAALACLFHQIHFFWWLGLLLGTGWYAAAKLRSVLLYALPALLVPAAYVAALPYWHEPVTVEALWRFVFHDYYAGTAGNGVSAHGLLLSVVNLGRTFVQVHGSTLALLRLHPVLWLVVVVFLGLLSYAAGRLWRHCQQPAAGIDADLAGNEAGRRAVVRTHLLILILHYVFALSAAGNAEFMVMLPALLTVVLGAGMAWQWPTRAVGAVGVALLIWNLAFGLIPNGQLRFTNDTAVLARVAQEPGNWFMLDNHNLVLNQLYYYTGQGQAPANVLPVPTLLVQRPGQSPARFRQWLRTQLHRGHRVFTNGLNGPALLDRAQWVYGNQNAALLRGFQTEKVDSFPTSFGPYYLTEVR